MRCSGADRLANLSNPANRHRVTLRALGRKARRRRRCALGRMSRHALPSRGCPVDCGYSLCDAMERDTGTTLATRQDLRLLEQQLAGMRTALRQEIENPYLLLSRELESLRNEVSKDLQTMRRDVAMDLESLRLWH